MDAGQIAGLIAAIAFAILAGFMIYPLIRLGRLLIRSQQRSKMPATILSRRLMKALIRSRKSTRALMMPIR